jgi:hypothetical protein
MMTCVELADLMRRGGIKPGRLARALEISPDTLYAWRTGRRPISRVWAKEIRSAVGKLR